MRGRTIFTEKYNNSANFREELNMTSARAGLYMVRVNEGEKVSIKKLIVQ